MLKPIAKLLIATFITLSLIVSNAYAFHKYNPKDKDIYENAELDEDKILAKHCALKIKKKMIQTGSNGFKEQETTDDGKLGWTITGYHGQQKNLAPHKWDFEIPVNNKSIELHNKKLIFLKTSNFTPLESDQVKIDNIEDVTLEEFLKIICLQYDEKERPSKFGKKKSPLMHELFEKIAEKNGFLKGDKPNIKAKLTTKTYKQGLKIDEPNVVYYIPDYLIAEHKEIKNAKSENTTKVANDEAKRIKEEEEEKASDEWIKVKKQPFLEKIRDKQKEYTDEIKLLKKNRDELEGLIDKHKEIFERASGYVKISVTYDNSTPEIKDLKINIIIKESTYLKDLDLDNFKTQYSLLTKIDFDKKYDNKKIIDELLDSAEDSTKKKHFVGYKPWGRDKKIGFIKEFDAIKKQDLGSKREENDILALKNEVNLKITEINENIIKPFERLKKLDADFDDQLPIKEIIIGLLIFLSIVGFIIYHFYSRKKLSDAERKAEERIGNLKRDFDGQLRNTSNEIKSVSRAARSQQSTQSSEQETVQEIPKTPEEIIASKYDALVTDYNEALEDFTKVAEFKQKWHGLALSRKERQDGTKTILISSSSAFEKSGIWCVTFNDNYFAFPGSTVKSNMATYMNMDFMKANMNFKGIFNISTGSNYSTEPAVLRKGGAGFVVERIGKISFPN